MLLPRHCQPDRGVGPREACRAGDLHNLFCAQPKPRIYMVSYLRQHYELELKTWLSSPLIRAGGTNPWNVFSKMSNTSIILTCVEEYCLFLYLVGLSA